MSSLRLPVAALLVLLGPAFTAASEQPADGAAERVLLNRYCVTCHTTTACGSPGWRSTRSTSHGSATTLRSGRRSSASSAPE